MSSKTTNLNLTKPSEDEFYDINVQNENMDIIDREINGLKQPDYEVSTAMSDLNSGEMITVAFGKIAKAVSTLISHVANKSNPHGVTKNQIGLGNVPNVATNDQTPTYTEASSLSSLVSGEKTSVAFGKIAKAVSTLISHTTSKATNSVLGHVKLSDSTSSTSASTAGVAATPKAVKAAYDLANSNTKKIGTTDISGIGDGTVTGAIAENKAAIEDVTQSLTEKINALVQKLHPVGSWYFSTVATNPVDIFGFGTWQLVTDRFLVGAGASYLPGAMGGEAVHTLTAAELPTHQHNVLSGTLGGNNGNYKFMLSSQSMYGTYDGQYGVITDDRFITAASSAYCRNQPHNNMPPYYAIYMWVRTA